MEISTFQLRIDEGLRTVAVLTNKLHYDVVGDNGVLVNVLNILRDVYGLNRMAEEYVYIACLSCSGQIIGFFEVSHGNQSSTSIGPREILVRALSVGASAIVVAHNHPASKTVKPSSMDIEATKALKAACDITGIAFVEHFIIGTGSNYYSMAEHEEEIKAWKKSH